MHGVKASSTVAASRNARSRLARTREPVTGATLHGAEFRDPASGARTWSVTIFDGSATFSLPGLSPNPLATAGGTDTLTVSALVIPGIDLGNVSFDDAAEKLTNLSSDQITVTP